MSELRTSINENCIDICQGSVHIGRIYRHDAESSVDAKDIERAESIVRAVNCHDELVAALKEARRYVEHQIDVAVGPMHAKYAQDDADKIDAALAKAGESSS